ncbi:hypothetical protein GTC6_11436 [Gordonia terrae C-6]|uniref:Anti-sigma factor n=2 Tax=Gordoniaceae TaxID=85026 RepID=R7Y9I2_9ACTN|nr:hypothetical protein GTC6_11436 [Gordonia terrae C-6]
MTRPAEIGTTNQRAKKTHLMTDSDATSQLSIAGGTPTVLRVPAATDRLALVRALVETALYVDDWALDDVIDAKVAVDEICSQIISAAAEGSSIELTLYLSSQGVIGEIRGELLGDVTLKQSTFGWRIVQTVTDTHTITYDEPGPDAASRGVVIAFSKFRR